jgi:hypothetical protein
MKITLYLYKPLETLDHFSQLRSYMDQKVWFTRLDQFNDPFEAHFIYQNARVEEILEYDYLFNRYCRELNYSSAELKMTLSSPGASEQLGKRKADSELFKNHGAICFTSDASNIPMWAHYASNHQGYCVVFEIDTDKIPEVTDEWMEKVESGDEILSFSLPMEDSDKHYMFTKVKYSSGNKKPVVEEKEHAFYLEKQDIEQRGVESYDWNKYFAQHSFGVKYGMWSYEQEYRLVVNTNSAKAGLLDLRWLPFLKITGVIMGKNIGKNLSKDAKDFILNQQLSGYRFTSSDLDGRVKEYIASMANQYGIKLYLAKCELKSEEYKITHDEYFIDIVDAITQT